MKCQNAFSSRCSTVTVKKIYHLTIFLRKQFALMRAFFCFPAVCHMQGDTLFFPTSINLCTERGKPCFFTKIDSRRSHFESQWPQILTVNEAVNADKRRVDFSTQEWSYSCCSVRWKPKIPCVQHFFRDALCSKSLQLQAVAESSSAS